MRILKFTLLAMCLSAASAAWANPVTYYITANTASIQGASGYLDFQFNPGTPVNFTATANLINFLSDGTLGSALTPIGDASGTLPTVSFDNAQASNEYTQAFTFGTWLSFQVNLAWIEPTADSPTSFLFTLYDNSTPIPNTLLAPGAVVELDINPDGSTTPITASGFTAGTSSAVPEPGTLWLLIPGLALAGWKRLRG